MSFEFINYWKHFFHGKRVFDLIQITSMLIMITNAKTGQEKGRYITHITFLNFGLIIKGRTIIRQGTPIF